MKKAVSLLTAALLTAACIFTAFSAESGFYGAASDTVDKNRLFDVDIFCDEEVSAAVVEIVYDSDLAAFRDVSAGTDNALVESTDEDGVVRVAFACESAADGRLFSVKFKSLKEGSFDMIIRSSDAASGSLDYLPACEYTMNITVNGSKITSKAVSSSKSGKTATSSKSALSEEDEKNSEVLSARAATADEVMRSAKSALIVKTVIFTLLAVLLVAALFFIGYLAGKKSRAKAAEESGADEPGEKTESSEK